VPFVLDHLGRLAAHGFDAVIDVRSPAEYALDHLPGAISLPVLSDAERARIGTIYRHESPFAARKAGAAVEAGVLDEAALDALAAQIAAAVSR
jgi:tRNA 2-selenouridine synthase